jgi:acetylornithine deacetylase/succinyl-diaminopimelate desuccinylase-like protein
MLLPELHVEIPADRFIEAKQAVAVTPGVLRTAFPLADGVRTLSEDDLELTLNSTWRPTLSVTGAEGLPAPGDAGNVLRPQTTLCLSFRLPPTADSAAAAEAVRRELTTDAPFGAQVRIGRTEKADGWNAPALAPWLRTALERASTEVFGAPWASMGMGGSIPFMGLLHEAYPRAQFVVTGALGPDSNAHVPDESLNLEYATKLTAGVALILNAHARRLGDQAG